MDFLTKTYVRVTEFPRQIARSQIVRGQTMTEYALIMAAIAVVVYATYKTLGTDISNLVSSVSNDPVALNNFLGSAQLDQTLSERVAAGRQDWPPFAERRGGCFDRFRIESG
jgi:Flp pilus assembly pilin Flp